MARIRSGPTGLVWRVQSGSKDVTLFLESKATNEIIVVVEMPVLEATALAAKLLVDFIESS